MSGSAGLDSAACGFRLLGFLAQRMKAHAATNSFEQSLRFEGFRQEIERPDFHRFHGRIDRAVARDDDGHNGRLDLGKMPQDFKAVHAGHLQIDKHNARLDRSHELKALGPVLRNRRAVSAHLKRLPAAFCEHFLVVDDDDIERH